MRKNIIGSIYLQLERRLEGGSGPRNLRMIVPMPYHFVLSNHAKRSSLGRDRHVTCDVPCSTLLTSVPPFLSL
jgi:hypothetical protein